jgi:geranylgeranyl diphosphate synthase, type I
VDAELLDADLQAFLGDIEDQVHRRLTEQLKRVPDVPPLRTGITTQVAGGGKRLRAALAVLASELFGEPAAACLDFAAAIEHLQNLSLIHDDIADGDRERRSQTTMWVRHGVGHAVNIGDGFLPLVTLSILEAPYTDAVKLRLFHLLAEYGLEMVEGQALDLNLRTRTDVSLQDYFDCTAKKTGALLSLATAGGAVIGGGREEHLVLLREFSTLAGVAFQIRDDLLDLEGGKGRRRGSDVLEGKRTILTVHAAQHAGTRRRARLFRILDKPRGAKSSSDVGWVLDLYRELGTDSFARGVGAELLGEASKHLLRLPDTPAKFRLLRLAKYLGERRH